MLESSSVGTLEATFKRRMLTSFESGIDDRIETLTAVDFGARIRVEAGDRIRSGCDVVALGRKHGLGQIA